MDKRRRNDQLGVNKNGKNIKKNTQLQKIRPVAITEINYPLVHAPSMAQSTHSLARPLMNPLPRGSRPMMVLGDQLWSKTAESPVSVDTHSGPKGNQMQPSHEYRPQPQVQGHSHHTPLFNGSVSSIPILPSPRFNSRGILPSPTSQYLLQSPTPRDLLSHRSAYPMQSQGVQYPPPVAPRSSTSSSMAQPGILGPGTFPHPPASHCVVFPNSKPRRKDL